jgi:hypothetical protein
MFQMLHGAAIAEDKAPLSLQTDSLVAYSSRMDRMDGKDRQK